MAATDLGELEVSLNVELGGSMSEEPVGSLDMINLLQRAVDAFNGETAQAFSVTGTVLDREASPVEKRALVLFAVLIYLSGRAVDESGSAIVHSNVAGRTDLSGVEFAMAKRRKELREQLDVILSRLTTAGVAGEVAAAELGETQDLAVSRSFLLQPSWYW